MARTIEGNLWKSVENERRGKVHQSSAVGKRDDLGEGVFFHLSVKKEKNCGRVARKKKRDRQNRMKRKEPPGLLGKSSRAVGVGKERNGPGGRIGILVASVPRGDSVVAQLPGGERQVVPKERRGNQVPPAHIEKNKNLLVITI